jgi:hypothetical protein
MIGKFKMASQIPFPFMTLKCHFKMSINQWNQILIKFAK